MRANLITRKQRQSGIALVIVLWMLSLLTILATSYSQTVRIETNLTSNFVHTSQAKAIAEAGIWQSITELLKPKLERQWKTDGTEYKYDFKQGFAKINIFNESGKIDLNTAQTELLRGLIDSIGLEEEKSLIVLDSILDWRDKDNLVRNHGAEDGDYRLNNYNYGAKDSLFNSLDELQLIMGMTPDIYNKLKPAITIYSRQPGINPNFAPKAALLALPGINEIQIDEFIQTRTDFDNTNTLVPFIGIDSKYLSKGSSKIFTISSEGIHGKAHAKLNVVVFMKKHLNKPYSILSWQESTGSHKTEDKG